MKARISLLSIIFLIVNLAVYAFHQDPPVTLHMDDATLDEVLREIKAQTGLNYLFSHEEIPEGTKVSVHVNDAKVEEALRECLEGLPLSFAIDQNMILIIPPSSRASSDELTQTIRGVVRDRESGISLPGSNVVYLGDIIVPDAFPLVWLEFVDRVGVEPLIRVLDNIIDRYPDDVRFLSAHGPDYSMPDLKRYRGMVAETVDLVRQEMATGATAESMKSEGLLRDWTSWNSRLYDRLNTDHWIETIHESLRRSSSP